MRRLILTLILAATAALAVPATAGAWKHRFQDFFGVSSMGGHTGIGASYIVAKKCSGGMLGTYKLEGRTLAAGDGRNDLMLEVRANMHVTRSWRRLTGVVVEVEAGPNFRDEIVGELHDSATNFWTRVDARWTPGKLTFRHKGVTMFGRQIVAPGQKTVVFKPARGC